VVFNSNVLDKWISFVQNTQLLEGSRYYGEYSPAVGKKVQYVD